MSAAMYNSDGEALVQDAQHAPSQGPVISTVCVDVRELLQRAAAESSGSVYRHDNSPTFTGTTPALRLPYLKSKTARTPASTSAFWSPGVYNTSGGGSGGPPPLSPADPTVLQAILQTPPSTSTGPAATAAPLSHGERSRGTRRQSPQVRGVTVSSAGATRTAEHDGRTGAYASASQQPQTDAVGPVPAGASSRVPFTNGSNSGKSDAGEPAQFLAASPVPKRSVAAVASDGSTLSPAAQHALLSVMDQLQEHTSLMLRGSEGEQEDGSYDPRGEASRTHAASSPHTGWSRQGYHNGTRTTTAASASPLPSRSAGAFLVGSTRAPAVRISHVAPQQPQPLTHLSALPLKGTQRGSAANAPAGTDAATRAARDRDDVGATGVPLPKRTIPPAFRRHLLYAESIPTTRRPKRK